MKKSFLFLLAISLSCTNPKLNPSTSSSLPLSSEFKSYWFDGTAEISGYALEQSRYGAPREGTAVLIYVTEDFLPDKQVKANQKSESTQTVLKLNRTKNFLTGIYPYSIMTSIFSRLGQSRPLVKTTTSIQEWCGQAYLQLNRRENLEVKSHSYFEGEADQNLQFKDALTEEERALYKNQLAKIIDEPIFMISAVSGEGIEKLLRAIRIEVDKGKTIEVEEEQGSLEWHP